MRVAFVSAGGTVRVTGAQQAYYVASVPSATTITVSATLGGAAIADHTAINLVAADWIVDATRDASMSATTGVPLDTAWRQEPMGLPGIFRDIGVLDGTGISTAGQQTGAYNYTETSASAQAAGFQGIQVNGAALSAAYPPPRWNRALVFDNATGGGTTRQINDAILQAADSAAMEQNGASVKLHLCAYAMYNSYIGTLLGDKRFNGTSNIAGGHNPEGGITFNGRRFERSRFMHGGQVTGLDTDVISIFENAALQPATAPGGNVWTQANDQDASYQTMMTSYQVFCELRDRAGWLVVDLV
jgi:hypothetical protein